MLITVLRVSRSCELNATRTAGDIAPAPLDEGVCQDPPASDLRFLLREGSTPRPLTIFLPGLPREISPGVEPKFLLWYKYCPLLYHPLQAMDNMYTKIVKRDHFPMSPVAAKWGGLDQYPLASDLHLLP